MFTKGIHSTTLTSEVADSLFFNINSTTTMDVSFLATLRALLRKRLPKDEAVWLTCHKVYRSKQELSLATTSECMNWFIPELALYPSASGHYIHIVYTLESDAGEKMLEIIKADAGTGKR